MIQSSNSVLTTPVVKTFTQKSNAAIPMKDSRKKQPCDVVDTSIPREKVGAHVKSPIRKHDFDVNKKRKKGACVDLGAITLAEYICSLER
jgi:hypothetical protein